MKNKHIYLLALATSVIFISSKAHALDKVQVSFSSDSINSIGYTNDRNLLIKAALDEDAEITENAFDCKNCTVTNIRKEDPLEYSIFVSNLQEGEVELVPDLTKFTGSGIKYVYDKSSPQAVLNYSSKDEIKFQISEKLFYRVGDDLHEIQDGESLKSFFSANRPVIDGAQYHDDNIGNRLLVISLMNLNRGDYLFSNTTPLLDASGNKLNIEKLIYNGLDEWVFSSQIKKPTINVDYEAQSNKNVQTIKIKTEIGNEVFLYSGDQLVLSYEQSSAEQSFEISQQNGQNNFRLFVRNAFLVNCEFSFKVLVDRAEPRTSYELSNREAVENDEFKVWGEADKDVENVELDVFDSLNNTTRTFSLRSTDGRWNFEIADLAPGFYELKLKIQDRFKNFSVIDLGGIQIKKIQRLTNNKPIKFAMVKNQVKSDAAAGIYQPEKDVKQESEIASAKGLLASGAQDSQSSGILVNGLIALLVIVFLSALGASVYFGYGYVLSSSRNVFEKVKVRKNEVVAKHTKVSKTEELKADEKEPPSIRW